MARITLRQLLDRAAENDCVVPAFNMSDMEQGLAIMAATSGIRRRLVSTLSEFAPRKFLEPAMDSMKARCVEKFEDFGTTGQADRIRVRALAEMASAY